MGWWFKEIPDVKHIPMGLKQMCRYLIVLKGLEPISSYTSSQCWETQERKKYKSLEDLLLKAQELMSSYNSKSSGTYGQS